VNLGEFVIILFSNTSKYRWEIWGYPQNPVKKSWNMMIPHDLELSYVQTHPYHLVISHSHGKSLINGGINGKIIYKWAIFHGDVKLPEGI